MRHELMTAWRRASTAELHWTTPNGPHGSPVVPLVWPGDRLPCVALPLVQLDEAESIPATVALSVPAASQRPETLVASSEVSLEWDLSGERFLEHLLPQEVAKHPPTRLRADSLLARRENWWWLPRILVTLTSTTGMWSLPTRTSTAHALLVRDRDGQTTPTRAAAPSVETVTTAALPRPGDTTPLRLSTPDGTALVGRDEPAYLFEHHHSPDFERWERWYRGGVLRGDRLHVAAGEGMPPARDDGPGSLAPFTLLRRLLNHHNTSRRARAGIAAAERRHAGS